jgi:nucleoside-diphosphate-sugar epimerase
MTKTNGKGTHNGGNGERRPDVVLVTGFPAFTAKRIAHKIVEADGRAHVLLLAREKFRKAAQAFVGELPPARRKRISILVGDVCDMDFGLTAEEFQRVTRDTTIIQHAAGIYYLGVSRETTFRVNVDGTRRALELAAACPSLRRFCHWSTAQVSGTRKGVVLEEELDCGQSFFNAYEESKLRAEQLVRDAARRLPITILRPSVIVGDSQTGEIDKFDGPYYLLVLIVSSPVDVSLPLPGRGSSPLYLAPIDFVVDAAYRLAGDERAIGKTFHLVDPCPLAARTVYEIIAARAHKKTPRGMIPAGLARALLRAPGLERLARAPLAFLESFNHTAFYNPRNTLELLRGSDVWCPPFESYVDNLIRFVKDVHAARKARLEEEVFDPFDA